MFQAPKLTNAGKALYYENIGGEQIKFTTIKLGSGTLSGSIATMTDLVTPIVTITAAVSVNDSFVDVSGAFSNADLTEGFYWREIGLFAANPDDPNNRGADILYCYQNAYDTADYIPLASVETVEKKITVPVIVGDATAVSCTLSASQVYVSQQDLENHTSDTDIHTTAEEKATWNGKQAAITASGILKGTGSAVSAAARGTDYSLIGSPITVTFAVASWTLNATTGAYEQSVAVSGLLTTDDQRTRIEPVGNASDPDAQALTDEAYACVDYFACTTNGQLYARSPDAAPTVAFSVRVIIER